MGRSPAGGHHHRRTWGDEPQSSPTVYVLAQPGGELAEIGKVDGLGKGERIYSVRFVGTDRLRGDVPADRSAVHAWT